MASRAVNAEHCCGTLRSPSPGANCLSDVRMSFFTVSSQRCRQMEENVSGMEKEAEAKYARTYSHAPHDARQPNALAAYVNSRSHGSQQPPFALLCCARLAAKYGGALPKRPNLLGAKEKRYFDSADHNMSAQHVSPSAPPAAASSSAPAQPATQILDHPEQPPRIR